MVLKVVRHGATAIPPHGLRRTWRVEIYHYGTYVGAKHYTSRRRALSAAHLHNIQEGTL